MKKLMKATLIAAVSAVCLMAGDLTITFNSKAKGPAGMSGEGIQTHYYSTNYQKTVDEGTKIDTMVDYGKGVFYTINHKEKKVEMMTFDDMVAIAEAMDAKLSKMANLPKFMQNALGGGDPGEVKVEKLGSDTVAGRACQKYKLTIGKLVEDLSMDPSLKVPVNPAAFAKFSKLKSGILAGPSAAAMKKLADELGKIQGMALKTHVSGFMGVDSTTEATKVDTGTIPATVFTVPAEYKTEDMGKKMLKDLQKG